MRICGPCSYQLDHLGRGTTRITLAGIDEDGDPVHGIIPSSLLGILIDRTRFLYDVLNCTESANAIAFLELEAELIGVDSYITIVEGHTYLAKCSDGSFETVTFVRRSGGPAHYDEEWPGPQSQEYLRALTDHIEQQCYRKGKEEQADELIYWLLRVTYEYESRGYRRDHQERNRTAHHHESQDKLDSRREGYRDIPFDVHSLEDGLEIDLMPINPVNGHLIWEEFE